MGYIIKDSKKVFNQLQDDYSRFLYEKRVMWSLTKRSQYLADILHTLIDEEVMGDIMAKAATVKDRLVIRGAGNDFWVLKRLYPDLDFAFFVDNDPTKIGRQISGKKVLSPDEFYENYSDYYVMVNSMAANGEMVNELLAHGIKEEKIYNIGKSYAAICDKQYFDKEILPVYENEVFIDGGCYDGRTVRQFLKYCDGRYKKIFSFEPDEFNYNNAKSLFDKQPVENLSLFNKGLWNEKSKLSFSADSNQASKITDTGTVRIDTISIDEVVGDEKVTFIKLDVEGAEYKALKGAKRTIANHHPKLAISIYHKPEDIFELPDLIMSIDDSYRFYIRHYQLSHNETILYGI